MDSEAAARVIVKRSMTIRGHRTSVSVEDAFWERLRSIARRRGCPLAVLVAGIDARRGAATNLSSAIRLFVLDDALSTHPASSGSAGGHAAGPAVVDA